MRVEHWKPRLSLRKRREMEDERNDKKNVGKLIEVKY